MSLLGIAILVIACVWVLVAFIATMLGERDEYDLIARYARTSTRLARMRSGTHKQLPSALAALEVFFLRQRRRLAPLFSTRHDSPVALYDVVYVLLSIALLAYALLGRLPA